jgi:hypothetical protein
MRRSRHVKPTTKPDFDIRATSRSLETLRLFDRYRLLPLNWMHALAGGGSYDGFRHLCTRMWMAGLLERRTLNGTHNNNETQSYSRTEAGDRYLYQKGYEPLPHDSHHDVHQSLVDISEAHIELGARGSAIEYHSWLDIYAHPKTPPLPPKPFRFAHGDSYTIPDGRPFYLKDRRGSILFVRELDRNTEAPGTIKFKLRNYRQIEDRIKQRYGFRSLMLLFITTNATREENILAWIAEEFPDGCKWILVSSLDDHIKHYRTTVPVTTHLFDTPYRRAGHRPFSLQTLSEA